MKILIAILLLFTVNIARAQIGEAIQNYRQNQENQNNQNNQTPTNNNTVIYGAPAEGQQLAAPRARAAAHQDSGTNKRNSHKTRNQHRGTGARNR